MKNSTERINFISDYISSYENKIKMLNKQGLFNDAKMFELFASKVGELYLKLSKPLINLNVETSTFPCVDLFSEDGNVFCQVSTCQNIPSKISTTLNNIKNSREEKIKSIKEVYFIVLNNESVENVKDLYIGNISFIKSKNLITTGNIINKAMSDFEFQEKLYLLLKKDDDLFKSDFKKFSESINYDSKVILDDIDEFINKNYHIDLSSQINEIESKNNKFILISGDAGSGKSVLCKKLLEGKKNILCARAEKLVEKSNVNEVWNFNLKDTISLLKDNVYIYIDALEFIADNRNKLDVLDSLLERLKELDNAYLICSCRSSDLASFIKTISKYDIVEYKTKPIDKMTLNNISNSIHILSKIINLNKYNSLLVSPFYINFLTKIENFDSIEDESQLREKIWKEIICLNNDTIGPIITSIALERATKFILYSDISKYDKSIIDLLISNDILIKQKNGVRLKYDIFEDICFEHYIDCLFDESKSNYESFFKDLEQMGRCIHRRYQIWIENKLFSKTNRQKFLYTLIITESIPQLWKYQSIIGIIKSNYCQDFFKEYYLTIIENGLLIKFIYITNIYGFELNNISFKLGSFILKNKGFGRESLIEIIYKNDIYKNNLEYASSIKKLIYDYTNYINSKEISTYSFEILKFYIESVLENNNYYYDAIKKEVEELYKLNCVADSWIKEFFAKIKSFVMNNSEHKNKFIFANDAIKDIISVNCICLLENYSEYIRELYDIYYTTIRENEKSVYNHYNYALNINVSFGLNNNADMYDHESFNEEPKYCNAIFRLLRVSFWPTLEWYLHFINKCVSTYKNTNDIYSYKIYFSKDFTKDYLGTSDMWVTGEYPNNVPTLISDMTFIVKSIIIELIRELDEEQSIKFANNIKRLIYEKTNNIIGLSIISNIGLTFAEKLPGYCLELVSSLEIVIDDMSRYSLTINNPARKMLENEMAKKVGLSDLSMDRYASIIPSTELRAYTFLTQIYYPHLKSSYFEIFDYLYSFVKNDDEHAMLYSQLQQMDTRNIYSKENDSLNFEVVSKIDGNAKKIIDDSNKMNDALSIINVKINNTFNSIKNKTITITEIDDFVKVVLEHEKKPLSFQFINILIIFISFALSKLEIDIEKRNEYCLLWIKYAKKQLNNEVIIIDSELYKVLYEQLNADIDIRIKNDIKSIILDLLINRNNNDATIFEIFNVTREFLISNKRYGTLYRNTIFLLAEDEMKHQIYNYKYLRRYHKDEKEEFIPNMQPRLYGIDYDIEQNSRKHFESKKSEIITKYLFEEKQCENLNMKVSKLDIKISSHIFSCGLDLNIPSNKCFVSSYLEQLIEVFKGEKHDYHYIIDYYELSEIEKYFQRGLLDVNNYSVVIDILFEQVDFGKFNNNTVNFYLNILASMTAFYFDAYDSKKRRKHIEVVIRVLEKYINNIPIKYVKDELSKALFLGFSKFNGNGDWSKYKTNYDYSDKAFLNDIFSKYGYLHFWDLLVVIHQLQYKKLLPEILISIYNSFKKLVELRGNRIRNLDKIMDFINQIIYYAYVNCESEIKGDSELINAFEGILSLLIELKDEKAAVLLDEFRIH